MGDLADAVELLRIAAQRDWDAERLLAACRKVIQVDEQCKRDAERVLPQVLNT